MRYAVASPQGSVPTKSLAREIAVQGATLFMIPERGTTQQCHAGMRCYEHEEVDPGRDHITTNPPMTFMTCACRKEMLRRTRVVGRHRLKKHCYDEQSET